MSIVLINHGTEIQIANAVCTTNAIDHLPAKVYTINFDPMSGKLSLVIDREKFELPKKLYGKLPEQADIIWNHYKRNDCSTGTLLFGAKGMGKTVLADSICNKALAAGIPVIYVKSFVNANLLYHIAKNISPVVFMFDEFDKLYFESNDQQALLTLFSDQDIKKQMFIVLGNHSDQIDVNYFHRPGRFHFSIKFHIIDIDVAMEIINDSVMEIYIKHLMMLYVRLNKFRLNYDILMSIVKVAKQSKNVEQFYNQLMIMNVPVFAGYICRISVVTISNNGIDERYDMYRITTDYKTKKAAVTLIENVELNDDRKIERTKDHMTFNVSISSIEEYVTDKILDNFIVDDGKACVSMLAGPLKITDDVSLLLEIEHPDTVSPCVARFNTNSNKISIVEFIPSCNKIEVAMEEMMSGKRGKRGSSSINEQTPRVAVREKDVSTTTISRSPKPR